MSSNPGQPNPQVDQAKQMFLSLTLGRRIALVAGVVGLIFSFFHWYTASYGSGPISGSASISGWHGWAIISVLLLIASAAIAVLPLIGIPSLRALAPSLPPMATDGMILLGAGVISALATILFMFTEGSGYSGAGYSEGPSIGAYVGLICGVAVAAGGYLMRTDPSA